MTTIVAEDDCTLTEVAPNLGVKMIQVVCPDTTVGGTDDVTVDLSKFGCTNVHGVLVFDETTTGSVVVNTAPTSTIVASSVLTVDLGGSDTGVKTIIIWAY
jgi:hypothetical protein